MSVDLRDRDGQPLTLGEWGARSSDPAYYQLAAHSITGRVLGELVNVMVVTVWLGLPKKMFETMAISRVDGGPGDPETQSWATEQAARNGHEGIVDEVRVALQDVTVAAVPPESIAAFMADYEWTCRHCGDSFTAEDEDEPDVCLMCRKAGRS